MKNVFDEIKNRVSVPEAARYYGYEVSRSGYIPCPAHDEKTPSCKLHAKHWHCFGCGEGGSVIDFAMQIFSLDALGAAKKLDSDFHLNLFSEPMSSAEREREKAEARKREKVRDSKEAFHEWKSETLLALTNVCYIANSALKKEIEQWNLTEMEAIRWKDFAEYLLDELEGKGIGRQMEVFRNRKAVSEICARILANMPTR